MDLDRLPELLVEPEADEHRHLAVHLQLAALAELLRVLDRQRVQPEADGQPVDRLVGRVLDVEPERLAGRVLDVQPERLAGRVLDVQLERLAGSEEPRQQGRRGFRHDLPRVIDPAAHRDRLSVPAPLILGSTPDFPMRLAVTHKGNVGRQPASAIPQIE
ncbi:hypothetical protein BJY16_005148 [Actinoplanes octamycinicus]|uniref:Uncharacterized protein n=1 Tax=Actinoplanes octamycinicus TaxID=135948 RepID=A0A7W7H0P4_9ACTN|nr:hypothetical protein [Actinoplanes octamycinicus]MBB4741689.1 hypothetical protein [Actinoplanes octamycinicus]